MIQMFHNFKYFFDQSTSKHYFYHLKVFDLEKCSLYAQIKVENKYSDDLFLFIYSSQPYINVN